METKHPTLKKQAFGVFLKKKHEHKEQKQLLKATTSSYMSEPRVSFLVANCTAKTKKPLTIGEELILHATKDMCCDILAEAAVQKVVCILFQIATELLGFCIEKYVRTFSVT